MFMKAIPSGFTNGDRATVTMSGELHVCHGLVHLVTENGEALILGEQAKVTNALRTIASLPANTVRADGAGQF